MSSLLYWPAGGLTWGLSGYRESHPTLYVGLKPAILSALEDSATLAVTLGSRFFAGHIPTTATLPAMAFRFVSSVHDSHPSHLRGPSGTATTRVRFEVRSHDVGDPEIVREEVRNRFQGLPGTLSGIRIHFVIFEHELDSEEPPITGSDLWTYHKQFDLRFKYTETLPTNK